MNPKKLQKLLILFIIPQYIKFFEIYYFLVDPSLKIVENLNIVPYSIVWQIINPLSTTEYPYKLDLLIIDTIIAYLLFRKLPSKRNRYILWQITDIHWFAGFFQNVSITWFALWIPLSPLLLKLPLGWSWNPFDFNNPHIQCALYCGARFTTSAITTYNLILIWTFISLIPVWNYALSKRMRMWFNGSRFKQTSKRSNP